MRVIEFIFIDFWHWLGAMTLLYVTLHYIVNLLNNFMRYRILRKHGYPPCDIDGDLNPIKEEEINKVNEQNFSDRR